MKVINIQAYQLVMVPEDGKDKVLGVILASKKVKDKIIREINASLNGGFYLLRAKTKGGK